MRLRSQPRIATRLPCTVRVGSRRYTGVVRDLSEGGLFIETSADADPGAAIELELATPEGSSEVSFRGEVVWRRAAPVQCGAAMLGGVGARITEAGEDYGRLLSGSEPASASRVWDVQVRSERGRRLRTLTIEAACEGTARDRAVRYAGLDWRVIGVRAL